MLHLCRDDSFRYNPVIHLGLWGKVYFTIAISQECVRGQQRKALDHSHDLTRVSVHVYVRQKAQVLACSTIPLYQRFDGGLDLVSKSL